MWIVSHLTVQTVWVLIWSMYWQSQACEKCNKIRLVYVSFQSASEWLSGLHCSGQFPLQTVYSFLVFIVKSQDEMWQTIDLYHMYVLDFSHFSWVLKLVTSLSIPVDRSVKSNILSTMSSMSRVIGENSLQNT